MSSLKWAPYVPCVTFLIVVPHWYNPSGTSCPPSLRTRMNSPAVEGESEYEGKGREREMRAGLTVGLVGFGEEGDGLALATCTTGSADAVDVLRREG